MLTWKFSIRLGHGAVSKQHLFANVCRLVGPVGRERQTGFHPRWGPVGPVVREADWVPSLLPWGPVGPVDREADLSSIPAGDPLAQWVERGRNIAETLLYVFGSC